VRDDAELLWSEPLWYVIMPKLTWGFAKETVFLDSDPESAYNRALNALWAIGRVFEEKPTSMIRGRTKFGLQRVSLNVFISPEGRRQRVEIEGFADDVWGWGARHGIRRLKKALMSDGRSNQYPSNA
jgi:hypothetical protein